MDFSIPQQKAIDIRDTNVVVSASAGSGKTAVLVERLCQLIKRPYFDRFYPGHDFHKGCGCRNEGASSFKVKGTTKNRIYSSTDGST